MRNDDETVGHLLSRRKVVALLGASGVAWLTRANAFAATPSQTCVVRPEQTEGPFFVDTRLNRRDMRSDPSTGKVKAGKPLALTMHVSRLTKAGCEPLPGAQVDLWHCDAMGVYSDPFLYGHQISDARGEVSFVTIYPGWYQGRTVHIHFKIRAKGSGRQTLEFTSQLYFDDALTDLVHAEGPYAANGRRRTRNQNDGIFRRGGDQLTVSMAKSDSLSASFAVAMQF